MLTELKPEAYQLFHEGTLALADVEANGMRVNVDYLNEAIEETDEQIQLATDKLREDEVYGVWRRCFGQKTNLDSRPQLSKVMFGELGYPAPKKKTDAGNDKADEEAFQDIDLPFIRLYIKRAKLQKLRGTYLGGIKRELVGDHIHTTFGLNVAATYRSMSEGPNIQNFPIRDPKIGKVIRSCFIPEENHRLIEMDYGQLEVRIAACYHKDPVLIKYITDPSKCMHRDTASEVFLCKTEEVGKVERYCAKNMFVFPEFYGSYYLQCAPNLWAAMTRMNLTVGDTPMRQWMSEHGIKKLGNLDPKAEQGGPRPGTFTHLVKKVEDSFWNKRFKVYSAWKKRWYEEYLRDGGFSFLTGFRVIGQCSRNDVINYPVQGAAFHCLLWSVIELNKALQKYKMKSRIISQIHDSILGSVHHKEVRAYTELAQEIMTERILRAWKWINVPLIVEAEACERGESWFDKKPLEI